MTGDSTPKLKRSLPDGPYVHPNIVRDYRTNQLVANADIPSGVCLIREKAVLIYPGSYSLSEVEELYQTNKVVADPILSLLPSPKISKQTVTTLDDYFQNSTLDSAPEYRKKASAAEIIDNSAISFGRQREMKAVFRHLSWIQHSCLANSSLHIPIRYLINDKYVISLFSVEDIPAGSVITASLVDQIQNLESKLAQIQQILGHSCECLACGDLYLQYLLSDPISNAEDIREIYSLRSFNSNPPEVSSYSVPNSVDSHLSTTNIRLYTSDIDFEGFPLPLPSFEAIPSTFERVVEILSELDTISNSKERAYAACRALFALSSLHSVPEHHWSVILARSELIISLANLKHYSFCWKMIRNQCISIFSIFPASCAEAQRLTMELGGLIIRAWMLISPEDALTATAGGLLKVSDALRREPTSKFAPTVFARQLRRGRNNRLCLEESLKDDFWIREMVRASEIHHPYIEFGFN